MASPNWEELYEKYYEKAVEKAFKKILKQYKYQKYSKTGIYSRLKTKIWNEIKKQAKESDTAEEAFTKGGIGTGYRRGYLDPALKATVEKTLAEQSYNKLKELAKNITENKHKRWIQNINKELKKDLERFYKKKKRRKIQELEDTLKEYPELTRKKFKKKMNKKGIKSPTKQLNLLGKFEREGELPDSVLPTYFKGTGPGKKLPSPSGKSLISQVAEERE